MIPVARERKSKFIRLFEPPKGGTGHGICPQFYTLAPGNGCPYSCSYCYLDKTLRSMVKGVRARRYEVYTNTLKMNNEVYDWLWKDKQSGLVLSAGEVLDSMATPEIAKNLVMVIDEFRQHGPGRDKQLLLLTKSTNIPDCEPCENVVLSWSINAPIISCNYEIGAPSPEKRFEAAMKARKAGWRVRVRIDPIMDDPKFEYTLDELYGELLRWMCELLPERITLGTMRRSGKPIWTRGKRVSYYAWFIDLLDGYANEIGLCKETPEVYKALGMSTENIKCNCTA